MNRNRELFVLSVIFWALVVWSAINPVHMADYLLELATPLLIYAALAATYSRFRFTPLSYRLILAECVILLVGAHYTHSLVPLFEWLKEPMGWQRNNYDRLAHFAVGFLMTIPVREVLRRTSPLTGRWLQAQCIIALFAWGAVYEVQEWGIAMCFSPETGAAYLGAQGDEWDAQKDILLDGLGAVAALLLFTKMHDRQLEKIA